MIPRRQLAGEIGRPEPGQLQGSSGQGAAQDSFSQRPDLWPPAGAKTFTRTGWVESAGNDQNDPADLILKLPDNAVGVIHNFSQYLNDMVAADLVEWSILVAGGPVQGWDKVKMFPTLASFRTVSDDPFIRVPMGAEIRIRINNRAALAKRIGASYSGWWWIESAAVKG